MGKMKATLPDYSPVEYEIDQPTEDLDLKMWAIGQALIHLEYIGDEETRKEYFKRLRSFAKTLINQLKKI